jgi:hypothetical protein
MYTARMPDSFASPAFSGAVGISKDGFLLSHQHNLKEGYYLCKINVGRALQEAGTTQVPSSRAAGSRGGSPIRHLVDA